MVVAGIRRTLSFSMAAPPSPRAKKPSHARSTSLPCRSHPSLSVIDDEIRTLRSAASLDHIDRLHASLDELLHLPQSHHALRHSPAAADRLLDALLLLIDAHALFRSAAAALRDHQSEARAALRRRDSARLAAAVRAHRRSEKDVAKIANSIKDLARSATAADASEAEILGEAVAATAAAASAVFLGAAAMAAEASAAAAAVAGDQAWKLLSFKRRESSEAAEMAAMDALEAVEESMEGLEKGCEGVLRRLVRTRVCLLNVLTPSF